MPDTNALMHYTRFDQFDWRTRLKVPQVRLIIPVAVVSEIDNKKYARRAEFWDRARDLLGLIDLYAESSPDGFAVVREVSQSRFSRTRKGTCGCLTPIRRFWIAASCCARLPTDQSRL